MSLKKYRAFWGIISVIIVIVIANYFLEKRKDYLMTKTKNSLGIVTHISKTSKGPIISYRYIVKGQNYISDYHGGSFIQESDTIKIKYSIEDPSLSKVLSFCYMQKYKGKCAE